MKASEIEKEVRALRASRNIHRDFSQYLCGQITFEQFIDICRKREAEFEAMKERRC